MKYCTRDEFREKFEMYKGTISLSLDLRNVTGEISCPYNRNLVASTLTSLAIVDETEGEPKRNVTELGFGRYPNNYGFLMLSQVFGFDTYGIDVDPEAIDIARNIGLDVTQGDVSSIDVLLQGKGKQDAIISRDFFTPVIFQYGKHSSFYHDEFCGDVDPEKIFKYLEGKQVMNEQEVVDAISKTLICSGIALKEGGIHVHLLSHQFHVPVEVLDMVGYNVLLLNYQDMFDDDHYITVFQKKKDSDFQRLKDLLTIHSSAM